MIGQNAACLAVAELDPKSVSAKKDQDPTSQSTPPLVVETAAKILKAKDATPQKLTPAPCGQSGRVGHPAGRLQFDSILFASVVIIFLVTAHLLFQSRLSDHTLLLSCSVTCGTGLRSRGRECANPVYRNGMSFCEGGPDYQQEDCTSGPCPQWSSWGEWSQVWSTKSSKTADFPTKPM